MFDKVFFGVVIINYLFNINVHALLHLDFDSDKYPFNQQIYKDALDPELCQRQLTYLTTDNPILLARFLDAGIRVPRGILTGNTIDLGNFHQCLAINEETEDMEISGKYCRIRVPVEQDFGLPNSFDRSLWKFDPKHVQIDNRTLKQLEAVDLQKAALHLLLHEDNMDVRVGPYSPLANVSFHLAVCIPRPCSSEQAINGLLFNLSSIGFEFSEVSCRLPDDRPWVTVDYVASVMFSIIGCLTLISTCYDLYESIYRGKDPKDISKVYTSFSVYTNTRRLLSFNSSPGSLECLDGVRALAMIWVILGHSFTVSDAVNPIEGFQWAFSLRAAWITVAPLTVDTFFFLSGLLLVYTTVGKLGRMELLKNLHAFYLHRLLRMFPILAAVILFESSFYLRVSDGPLWNKVAYHTFRCREFWWTTLLHLQNIVNPLQACIGVSWYLAIDVQLHILSPIILFWVLGSHRAAWTALNTALVTTLTASTVYNFIRNFPSGSLSPNRMHDMEEFYIYYYVNVFTRASPFLVGMVYGYLLHHWRKNNVKVSKILTTILLLCSLLMIPMVMYCAQIAMRLNWDNQLADNFFNSFLRPLWALALGWIIFACVQGRAEPINWFLSLRMWKLPARLSYAMYLIHNSIVVAFYSSITAPIYFSVPSILFNFMAFMLSTLILSFFVTLLIDSPFSTIFKLLLGGFQKTQTPKVGVDNHNCPEKDRNGITNDSFTLNEDTKKLQSLNLLAENGDMKVFVHGEDDNMLLKGLSKSQRTPKQIL